MSSYDDDYFDDIDVEPMPDFGLNPADADDFDERGPFILTYGYFGSGDPRDFTPDYELCSSEEIARWQADVALAESGDITIAPPAGEWVLDQNGNRAMHILAPKYGIGVYKYRPQEADDDAQ